MSRVLCALAIAVAVASAATIAAASPAAAGGATSFTLLLPATTSTYVDLGRKSYSAGDFFLSRGPLLDPTTRTRVGRLGGTWTILSRQADQAAFNVGLKAGTLFVVGRISHTAPRSILTVTGGTGRFRTARGTVTFRYLSETSASLAVNLE